MHCFNITVATFLLGCVFSTVAVAQDRTELITVNSRNEIGKSGGGDSGVDLSFDGPFVVFGSRSRNLIFADTNGTEDIFVRDRVRQTTKRISVGTGGVQGDNASGAPAISALGRYVAFNSDASNLVPGDGNGFRDAFLHDRRNATTELISARLDGASGNGPSENPVVSRLGRLVAFESLASDLVSGDTNGGYDVFLRDRQDGVTSRLSVSSGGRQGNQSSFDPSMSDDGRFVVFTSKATNLVTNDSNDFDDIYVRDRRLGTTGRVSVNSNGGQANGPSSAAEISGNGRYVAFLSDASNLVPGDENDLPDLFVRDLVNGVTTLVPRPFVAGSNGSDEPSISTDGRSVAFSTDGDVVGTSVLFVVDRQTSTSTVVNVNSRGEAANRFSFYPTLAGDGRDVAFVSQADNLEPRDSNGGADVFVRDR
jgi:Tol biopolymer transport system component